MRSGIAASPFGSLLLAGADSGLRWASFVKNSSEARRQLAAAFPDHTCSQDDAWAQATVNKWIQHKSLNINLNPDCTSFQKTVWNVLIKVPLGTSVSYSELARLCGQPRAVRAVASAVARNPIALFIPCHRVVPKDGSVGNYRWGSDKKRALLEWEAKFRPKSAAHPQIRPAGA